MMSNLPPPSLPPSYSSEFCSYENVDVDMSVDAVPQDGVVDYLLEPAEPPEEEEDEKPDNEVTEKKDAAGGGGRRGRGGLVIFAMDVSGSMSSTTEVPALQGEPRN